MPADTPTNDAHIGLGTVNLATIVVYIVVLIAVGFWFSRRDRTTEDFLLGGRRIPWWAVGLSYVMSLASTLSLVMIPGEIYDNGLSAFFPFTFIYPFASVAAFFLFLRFYYKLKVFTPFSYLQRRYDASVRLMISGLYLWTRLSYIALVLYSSAKVFDGAAGWNPYVVIPIIALVGILYTVLGGMRAVVWTDVLQFFVLFGGLAMAIVICTRNVDGGVAGVLDYAFAQGRGPVQLANPEFYRIDPYVRLCFWMLLLNAVMDPIFFNGCDQITVQRLLSTRSYRDSMMAAFTNGGAALIYIAMLCFVGLAVFSFYGQHPDPTIAEGDKALFKFIGTKMPPPLPGLMLAAMLAAAMSTLDSGMNSLSAVVVKDFYLRYRNSAASEAAQVRLARWLTLAIGVFAAAVAMSVTALSENLRDSVMETSVVWGALGVVLGPVFLLGVTTRRVTGRMIWIGTAAAWGINCGMVTWYIASKNGLDRAIPLSWVAVPASLTAVMVIVALASGSRQRHRSLSAVVPAVFGLAYSSAMVLWFISGQLRGGQLSFMWNTFPGLLLFLLIGYTSVLFGKKPDECTHKGLTLFSADEPVEPSS